jgi:hypothetical protein
MNRQEPKLSLPDVGTRVVREIGNEIDASYAPKMLARLETRLNDKLFDIADLLLKLNYGDMVTFGEGVGAEPRQVFEWAKERAEPK